MLYTKELPIGEPIFFEGKYKEDKVYNLYIQMLTCTFKIKKRENSVNSDKKQHVF